MTEKTKELQTALQRIQFFEARKRMRQEALRTQYIQPKEITG